MNTNLRPPHALDGREPAPASEGPAAQVKHPRAAAWKAVLIIAAAIFFGEAAVMFGLNWAQATQPLFGLLDALLVTALSFLLLYRFVLRPLEQSNARLQAEIEQRRRIEAALRVQTAALHAAAHSVMITDRAGRITWVNPAFSAMTGYTLEECVGQTPRILNSGRHDPALYRRLWQTIQAGEVWRGELVNRRKDGALYSEEQTITPVRDDSGEVAYYVSIKIDCTQRKLVEEQLARHNRALVALSQAERHQRQFAEALVQATHALNTSLVLDEVLDRILEQMQQIVPCRAAGVMLLRGNLAEVARQRDAAGTTSELPQGFRFDHFPELARVAAQRAPRLVGDTADEEGWTEVPGLPWVRSLVVAPLVEDGRVTGFLGAFSGEPDFFDREAIAYLEAFAAHAAVAVQNARLYRAELYARRTAETLSAASLDLTRTLQLQAVLDSLLRHLRQLVPFDGAHLALLAGETHLAVQAATGDDPWAAEQGTGPAGGAAIEAAVEAAIDVDETPALQRVIYEKQSVLAHDARPVPGSSYFAALEPMRSWLGVPIIVGDAAVGLCGLEKREPDFFTTEHMRLVEVTVAQAAVAIQNAALFQQVESGREQLQSLSHRLVQAQENERRHIARELHDEASQALTSLKFGLRHLGRQAGSPDAAAAIAGLCDVTDAVLENLHRLAMDLRPASLDHLGLVVALRDHVANLNRQHAVEARFEAIGFDGTRLPADLETALYRITQEALTNVVRHAHATQVDLLLHLYPDRVRLTVEDDGVGFDPAATTLGQMGLVGMRERCEMLGGKLTIESTPGHGTTVVTELPRIGAAT